jgi:hypothetical protein
MKKEASMILHPHQLSRAASGVLLFGTLAFAACAPAPAPAPLATPTSTVTATLTPAGTPTPLIKLLIDSEPTRTSRNQTAFCNLPQSVVVSGERRFYCLYRVDSKFGDVTTLAEIMSEPSNLIDEEGNELVFDSVNYYNQCGDEKANERCYAFVWYQKNRRENAFALARVWPTDVTGTTVAPILEWNHQGDARLITNWRVVLVDRNQGKPVQTISNSFVKFNGQDAIVFDSQSGFLEIASVSGDSLTPTDQRVGLHLATPKPPVGIIENTRLYEFSPEDAERFQNIFDWMKTATPNWRQFVLDQRPYDITLNPRLADRKWYGSASCCWTEGLVTKLGRIQIRERPPKDVADNLYFVSALVHEATHIRDRRAKTFDPIKLSITRCRAVERSAVESEVAFLLDVITSNADQRIKSAADRILKQNDAILAAGTFDWNPDCH